MAYNLPVPAQDAIWSPAAATARIIRKAASGGRSPNPRAVQSLLVYGAVLPPLTAWDEDGGSTDGADISSLSEHLSAAQAEDMSLAAVRRRAVALLDQSLSSSLGDRRPLVLFSGGVDSGLMAARLEALGRKDTLLVHYSFGADDPETAVAVRMATELGLDMAVVRPGGHGLDCLDNPGTRYPVPFGDQSAPATGELCDSLPEIAPASEVVVFDGTGADGGFGLGPKIAQLERLLAIPGVARSVAGRLYRDAAWRSGGVLEHRLRVMRRSSSLSSAGAVIAQNALFGTLYDAPDLPQIDAKLDSWVVGAGGVDVAAKVVLADLVVTCASIFAQKTYGPLRALGYNVAYPFLGEAMGIAGTAYTIRSGRGSAPKEWMRAELSSRVDPALVERPKSGFIDPSMSLFRDSRFLDAVHEAIRPDAVAGPWVRPHRIERLLADDVSRLPHGHKNLLWTLAFMDRWYQTAP